MIYKLLCVINFSNNLQVVKWITIKLKYVKEKTRLLVFENPEERVKIAEGTKFDMKHRL